MAIEISPTELTVLHTSVERLAGTLSALIAHFQREGSRELAELNQLAVEDIVRLRDFLTVKGVNRAPLVRPNPASSVGIAALRDVFLNTTQAPPVDLDQHRDAEQPL